MKNFLKIFTILWCTLSTSIYPTDEHIAGLNKAALTELLDILHIEHDGALPSLIEATQREFLRKPGTERWNTPDLYEEKKEQLIPIFKKMGLVLEKLPEKKEYEAALILGSANRSIEKKIDLLTSLIQKGTIIKSIVILSGERILSENERNAVAQDYKVPIETLKTEADSIFCILCCMLQRAQITIPIKVIRCLNAVMPNGTIIRPTRLDTIQKWIEECNPNEGNYLAFSIQPHSIFEKNVIESVTPENICVEVIAPEWQNVRVAVYLDAIARALYAYTYSTRSSAS